MLVTFTISMNVEDVGDDGESKTLAGKQKEAKHFDEMLSAMEDIVAKNNYYLDDARWDAE